MELDIKIGTQVKLGSLPIGSVFKHQESYYLVISLHLGNEIHFVNLQNGKDAGFLLDRTLVTPIKNVKLTGEV